MKVLVVEDDKTIASGLEYMLENEGYKTQLCFDVKTAQQIIHDHLNDVDLCLLDLSLPDGSGYDLCESIKKKKEIPVIFLTASEDEVHVVRGLDLGADDYVTKPFRVRELLSRMRSVLRRYKSETASEEYMILGSVQIYPSKGKVYKNGAEVLLTALEYRLLLMFAQHRGQVLTRGQLLEWIWDVAGDYVNDNTLTVYIKRLRDKLEDDPQHPTIIETVRGQGYRSSE